MKWNQVLWADKVNIGADMENKMYSSARLMM